MVSDLETARIREAIKEKYRAVARSEKGYFRYPVGREGAQALGYEAAVLDTLPDSILDSFCGVGNPLSLKPLEKGSAVLDVGCGVGIDVYVASRLIGKKGRVCGVDLTEDMVRRARKNMKKIGVENAEIEVVASERLPYPDAVFDVAISNGVINLSPNKPRLFGEIYRVLKPGGRLQFADIIREADSPSSAVDARSWSQ